MHIRIFAARKLACIEYSIFANIAAFLTFLVHFISTDMLIE